MYGKIVSICLFKENSAYKNFDKYISMGQDGGNTQNYQLLFLLQDRITTEGWESHKVFATLKGKFRNEIDVLG